MEEGAVGTKKVIVLGGGVFGLSSALELRRRGCSVSLLEGGSCIPADGATSNDYSRLVRSEYGSDLLHTELALESMKVSWNERVLKAEGEALFHECGVCLISRSFQKGSYERDSYELHSKLQVGVSHERIRFGPVRAGRFLPPLMRLGGIWGSHLCYNERGGWADAHRTCACLRKWCEEEGVEIETGEKVIDVDVDGVVSTQKQTIDRTDADVVVLALGAYTPDVVPQTKSLLHPTAQPIVYVEAPDLKGGCGFAYNFEEEGIYGFPVRDIGGVPALKLGLHAAGVPNVSPLSLEEEEKEQIVQIAYQKHFRPFLSRVFPALASSPIVHSRVCYYCDSVDGDFVIDNLPGCENIFVASGGSGHAFKFTPVLGRLVADAVEGKKLSRYSWREGDSAHRRRETSRSAAELGFNHPKL